MSDWFGEEQEMDVTTAKEFEALVDSVFTLRAEYEAEKSRLSELNGELELKKQKVAAFLKEFGKTKHLGRLGSVSVSSRLSVRTPKTPDEKEAFKEYLEEKGALDLLSINSRTLQSLYKEEMEAALEEGNIDFSMPGVGEPTFTETLTMRKQK